MLHVLKGAVMQLLYHLPVSGRGYWMNGWLRFYGILSTQIASISS